MDGNTYYSLPSGPKLAWISTTLSCLYKRNVKFCAPGRPGRLHISLTPRIFSIIIANSFLHKMCTNSHTLNTKRQITVAFTSYFRNVSSQREALCHLRGAWNLKVVPRYLEKLWNPVLKHMF